MPEILNLRVATEARMAGGFLDLRLSFKRGACDLSRIKSPSGMAMLYDHQGDLPAGRIRDARIRDRALYMTAEVISTPRNKSHLAELRAGLRPGISPGFIINAAELEEDQDGEYCLEVTEFMVYEVSSTPIPRNPAAAILDMDGGQDDTDDDDDDKHTMVTDTAALAGALASKAVASALAESAKQRKTLLSTYAASTVTDTTRRRSSMSNEVTAKHEDTGLADINNVDVFKAALNGGEVKPEHLIGGTPGQKCVVKLNITSASGGIVGIRSGADRLDPKEEITAASRILSLPNLYEMESLDQQTPEWATDAYPAAATVQEDAIRLDLGGSLVSGSSAPKRIDASANISTIAASMAPGFEEAVLRALYASTDELMAQQLIAGDVAQSPLGVDGIRSITGVGAATYTGTEKGSAATFWNAEDFLPERMPSDRRSWVLSEGLYRVGRRTLLEPGNSLRVVQDGRVAGDSPAIRSSLYPNGEAVYGEFSFCNLFIWSEAVLTVDRVSTPGTIKLTLSRYWNFGVSRPDAFTTLKPA